MATYHTLQDLVLGNGGITNVTFVVPCRPCSYAEILIEMQIEDKPDNDLDSIHGTYKVRLVPVSPEGKRIVSYERFYQCDLMSMVSDGRIKVKIGDMIA